MQMIQCSRFQTWTEIDVKKKKPTIITRGGKERNEHIYQLILWASILYLLGPFSASFHEVCGNKRYKIVIVLVMFHVACCWALYAWHFQSMFMLHSKRHRARSRVPLKIIVFNMETPWWTPTWQLEINGNIWVRLLEDSANQWLRSIEIDTFLCYLVNSW